MNTYVSLIYLLCGFLMKEASVMMSTKYKDDDNNNHDDDNASKLCSIIFLSRPKHFPLSDHSTFKGGRDGKG